MIEFDTHYHLITKHYNRHSVNACYNALAIFDKESHPVAKRT